MKIKDSDFLSSAKVEKQQLTLRVKWLFGLIAAALFALPGMAQSPLQDTPTIKLLDPGSAPRKTLRFHVKAGDKESMAMTMKMSMQMPGGPAAGQAMKIPAMTMPMDLTVQSVAPNGDISYQMIMGEPDVADDPAAMPTMVQAMKTALASFKGLTINGVMSDRGITRQVDMKIPDNANPAMRQSMDQMKESMNNMGAPFPQEAVGPGAKWELKMRIKSGGISLDQTATYQLASLDGDRWSAKCTIEQSAGKQTVQNPSLGSAQMNLLQMTSNGGGTLTSDLSKILPLHGNIDTHVDMNSEIKSGETTQPMAMKMDMSIGMEGK